MCSTTRSARPRPSRVGIDRPGTLIVALQVTDSVGVISTSTATVDVLSNGNGNGGRPPGRYGRG